MTITTTTEKHKEFFIFPVFAIVWHLQEKELYIELGLYKYTLTILTNFKTK
jgi:hypothetical protein